MAEQAAIAPSPLSTGPGEMMGNAGPGMLAGLRVIEIADERAEYAGLLLAGLGRPAKHCCRGCPCRRTCETAKGNE